MTASESRFTSTTLVAAAAEILQSAGFRSIPKSQLDSWAARAVRIYEDPYSIVCVAVYETWTELSARWTEDQSSLADLISRHFDRSDAKAWEGYLVLFTPSHVPAIDKHLALRIQRNTLRVRKLFGDGEELSTIAAIRRTLLPLLTIEEYDALEPRNTLDTLQPLLASYGIDQESIQVAIEAFRDDRPVIEELHTLVAKKQRHQT